MTLYKRPGTENWYYDITVNGVRKNGSTRTTDHKLALAFEAQQRVELTYKTGTPDKGQEMKFSEAAERMKEGKWETAATVTEQYIKCIRIVELLDDPLLSSIDEAMLDKLRKKLKQAGLKGPTINRYFAVVRAIMRQASLKWKVKCTVPSFEMAKEHPNRMRIISQEEQDQLLAALRACTGKKQTNFPALADLFEVLVDTGMRLGESLAITYKANIDFLHSVILLRGDITKSDKDRSIPMTSRVKAILERRQAENPDRPFPFKDYQAEAAWSFVRRNLGIADHEFCIHALRHTFASRILQRGGDLATLQQLLGHSTILMTMKYAHLQTRNLRTAVNLLESQEVSCGGL